MKTEYNITLKCATCGNDSHFEANEDKSHIKCTLCNREYLGGYDELVKLNREIAEEEVKRQMSVEFEKEVRDRITQALKGSKYIKFK